MNSFFFSCGQKFLQSLPPEIAHDISIKAFASGFGPEGVKKTGLETNLAGLILPNPIGCAAGFDKDALVPDALLKMGFGFVECGTVTPLAQIGNPKPRLFRLKEDQAIINAMGFNNHGLDEFVAKLSNRRHIGGIVGANIGANKDSDNRIEDYAIGLKRVWVHSSYITINISSPNTAGLRGLQQSGAFEDLLLRINKERALQTSTHGHRPVFVKVAPDLDDGEISHIANTVSNAKIDGLIVSNTTLARPKTLISMYKSKNGGLSGRPLFEKSTAVLQNFRQSLGNDFPIIGVGGISCGDDAIKKLEAGANALQLYTAFIYRGPKLIADIHDAISEYRAK